MERTCGSCGAIVGSAERLTAIAHPDRAVVEPSGSGLERGRAARLNTGSTPIHRLGRTSACVRGATDGRTCVERTRAGGVGRPEDRRAGGSRRTLVVGAGRAARRAGGRGPTVEFSGRCSRTCSVVAPRTGTGRARGSAQLDRRGSRGRSRGPG